MPRLELGPLNSKPNAVNIGIGNVLETSTMNNFVKNHGDAKTKKKNRFYRYIFIKFFELVKTYS